MRLYLFLCVVFLAASASALTTIGRADSDESGKQEEVYRHRQSKDILPFTDILKIIRPLIQGEIIEAEFEIEHGTPTYEFKYIDKSGRVREMYVDAKTGKIIKDYAD